MLGFWNVASSSSPSTQVSTPLDPSCHLLFQGKNRRSAAAARNNNNKSKNGGNNSNGGTNNNDDGTGGATTNGEEKVGKKKKKKQKLDATILGFTVHADPSRRNAGEIEVLEAEQ